MPSVQLNNFAMHYEITGSGPETLLLIHGNIASCRWWDKYLSFLPAGCRAVAMDLRGCGQSGRPGEGHTIRQFADDIHFLVQALDLKRFHLLGHSLGGQIGLCYYSHNKIQSGRCGTYWHRPKAS